MNVKDEVSKGWNDEDTNLLHYSIKRTYKVRTILSTCGVMYLCIAVMMATV